MGNAKIIMNDGTGKYLEIEDLEKAGMTKISIGHYRNTDWVDDASITFEGTYQEFLATITHKLLELTASKGR